MERQHWTGPEKDITQMWSSCYNTRKLHFLCFDMTNIFSGHFRAPLERTKLHDAAERGKVERVQRLLSTGFFNINSRTVIVSVSIMALVDTYAHIRLHLLAVSGVGLTLTKFFLSPQNLE